MGKSRDAFRTISEVAEWLNIQTHVLRFWESKFSQVKPVKRAGGRRYYRPHDMLLLGGIKKLLHDDGMTIKGAQKLLREQGVKHVSGLSQPVDIEENTTKATVDVVVADKISETDAQPDGVTPDQALAQEVADSAIAELPTPAAASLPADELTGDPDEDMAVDVTRDQAGDIPAASPVPPSAPQASASASEPNSQGGNLVGPNGDDDALSHEQSAAESAALPNKIPEATSEESGSEFSEAVETGSETIDQTSAEPRAPETEEPTRPDAITSQNLSDTPHTTPEAIQVSASDTALEPEQGPVSAATGASAAPKQARPEPTTTSPSDKSSTDPSPEAPKPDSTSPKDLFSAESESPSLTPGPVQEDQNTAASDDGLVADVPTTDAAENTADGSAHDAGKQGQTDEHTDEHLEEFLSALCSATHIPHERQQDATALVAQLEALRARATQSEPA